MGRIHLGKACGRTILGYLVLQELEIICGLWLKRRRVDAIAGVILAVLLATLLHPCIVPLLLVRDLNRLRIHCVLLFRDRQDLTSHNIILLFFLDILFNEFGTRLPFLHL